MQKLNLIKVFMMCCVCFTCVNLAFAMSSETDRIAIEAKVKAEITKDLSMPYNAQNHLKGRQSIDGRTLDNFDGNIIEYWVNLECTYCKVSEPLQAQRDNENIRIVVRHIPTKNYGESLKKALSYEALKHFSANAANFFWGKIIPKTSIGIPVPYESSLISAFQDANIDAKAFSLFLTGKATKIIDADILASQQRGGGRIFSTPTYVIEGIRFPACDFTAKELLVALDLAKKARAGDDKALDTIIKLVVNGLSNVPMFDKSL